MDNNFKKNKRSPLLWLLLIPGVLILCIGVAIVASYLVYLSDRSTSGSYSSDSIVLPGTSDYTYKDISNASDYTEEYAVNEAESSLSYDGSDSSTTWGDKIIKTGSLSLVVDDLDAALTSVKVIVETEQGYIVTSNDYDSTNGERIIALTFKVPQERFDSAYEAVKAIADEVVSASVDANDVTQEYTDLQSRLTNLQAAETQYLSIMTKATDIEDILAVQGELTTVREEIELIQGQINYYDSYTDFSTITVYMSLSPENITVPEEKWRPWAVVVEAWDAFLGVLKGVFAGLVWILIFSPCILIPILIVVMVIKRIKKKNVKQNK